MKIYHGSKQIITNPQFGLGKPQNDYGRGFYCTESIELAKEWACAENTDGFANEYELNTTNLSILNLNDSNYSILNWLALLTKYRGYWQQKTISEEAKKYIQDNFLIDIEPYDVIIGNRADDSYFSFVQDFASGTLSLNQLEKAMCLGKLGEQIVLKSPKAFEAIKFNEYHDAYANVYYTKKNQRDQLARKQYRTSKSELNLKNEIYILDIMRKGMTNDDFLR